MAAPRSSQAEIAGDLVTKAQALFGKERAEAIRPVLLDMAGHLWQILHNLPHHEEEPAFFFKD